MTLTKVSSDILILVLETLNAQDLASLSETCRYFHALVFEFGWSAHLRSHRRPSYSLSHASRRWSPAARVRYNTLVDRAWSRPEFLAFPLSYRLYPPKQARPCLAISPSRLILATGRVLQSYKFTGTNKAGGAPPVKWEFSCNAQVRGVDRPTGDVTAIQFVPDGGKDLTVLISFSHGAVERARLTPSNNSTIHRNDDLDEIFQPSLHWHSGDHVNSLSTADNYALSLSYEGTAIFFDAASPRGAAPAAQAIRVGARGWATHLSLRASTPYAAFGTNSTTPLAVHAITNAELSPTPTTLLAAPQITRAADRAVYDIASGPPSSPWGSSDQILVSGWFSGVVRVHDLRVPARTPTGLLPVMSLQDKWSEDSIYAVSCGGGGASHIAAGSARNGITRLWDVRAPADGWAVYAPGNDRSPVYDLVLESSRLFGATDSRAFVFDFGPGVTQETYPRIQDVGLKPVPQGGCYVTKYRYADSMAF